MGRTISIDESLETYIRQVGVREPELLARLREETAVMGRISGMQIGPDQGAIMGLLAKLIGARRYLEIGVFTGYSSLSVALAMPADGHVTALDVSEEFTSVARRYWAEAGVAKRIDLKLAPAGDSLAALKSQNARYDMAFIDADKSNYDLYYEACLELVRPGGLIAIDNVLWSGAVADPSKTDADTVALRALNVKIKADNRVDAVLASIGDGLYLVRPR